DWRAHRTNPRPPGWTGSPRRVRTRRRPFSNSSAVSPTGATLRRWNRTRILSRGPCAGTDRLPDLETSQMNARLVSLSLLAVLLAACATPPVPLQGQYTPITPVDATDRDSTGAT